MASQYLRLSVNTISSEYLLLVTQIAFWSSACFWWACYSRLSLFSTSGTLTFIRLPWCGDSWPLFIDRGVLLNQLWKILSKYSRKSFLRSRARVTGPLTEAGLLCCVPACMQAVCVSVCFMIGERAIKIPSFLNPHGPPGMHGLFRSPWGSVACWWFYEYHFLWHCYGIPINI